MFEIDGIVCVLVYPESGDQAAVYFLNMAFAKASPNPDVQQVYVEVVKALKDSMKMGDIDFDILSNTLDEKCWIVPPCFLSDSVTIYEKC